MVASSRRAAVAAWRLPCSLAVLLALFPAGLAQASPVSGALGLDHVSGPHGQTTHAGVAVLRAERGRAGAFVSGTRFENSVIGAGLGGAAGVVLPMGPSTQMVATGALFTGPHDYRDWRGKVGPRLLMPGGVSLGAFVCRDESLGQPRVDSWVAEAGWSVLGVSGRLSGGVLAAEDGARGWQGSVGASGFLVPGVEMTGDLGLLDSRLGYATGTGPRASLPLLGPLSGGTTSSGTRVRHDVSLAVGVRLHLP